MHFCYRHDTYHIPQQFQLQRTVSLTCAFHLSMNPVGCALRQICHLISFMHINHGNTNDMQHALPLESFGTSVVSSFTGRTSSFCTVFLTFGADVSASPELVLFLFPGLHSQATSELSVLSHFLFSLFEGCLWVSVPSISEHSDEVRCLFDLGTCSVVVLAFDPFVSTAACALLSFLILDFFFFFFFFSSVLKIQH